MKFTPLAIAITAVFITSVNAHEVDDSVVTTFSAGTPAVATEVNTNFAQLISAINDNAVRIAAFEKLSNPVVNADDLDGSRYCYYFLDVGVGAEDPNEERPGWKIASTGSETGQIDFSSSTQGTISPTKRIWYEQSHPLVIESEFENPEMFMFSYSAPYVTITFTDDEGGTETDRWMLSPDGNTLILNFSYDERSDDDTGNFGFAGMAIGIRADSCS